MLGTEASGVQLAVMVAAYARKAKEGCIEDKSMTGNIMYSFYDALEHASASFCSVLDAKRTVGDEFNRLIEYATNLQATLDASVMEDDE